MLDAVLRKGLPMDAAVGPACKNLKREDDKRFAVAIASEVFRRMPDYDALIDSAMKRNLPDDAKARMVLRLALAQTLVLDTPAHAAIATALPLLKGGPKRLAHGVFGTLSRSDAALPETPTLPEDVRARWSDSWGGEMVASASAAIANPPPLDLTLIDPSKTTRLCEELDGVSLMPGHVRLDRQAVTTLAGFENGDWWVQDVAASLPSRLLGSGDGRRALDLCAAPGGKTLQLAAAGWDVTAIDAVKSRIRRLSDNLDRTKLRAELVNADILEWSADAPFDAVLLDAPCSATGIFRRHPDVLYRAGEQIIAECAETQFAMIERAADWVRPDGQLVYAVCSLEPAEGEAVVDAFLHDRKDFVLDSVEGAELPKGIPPTDRGYVRILPGMIDDPGGADGFFIARFRRS